MPIRRTVVVEEYDDPKALSSQADYLPTGARQLAPAPKMANETGAQIESDMKSASSSDGTTPTSASNAPKFGRTFADLYHDAAADVRLVSTLLFFVPFPFFVANIKSVADLMVPGAVGLALNLIWHGVGALAKRFGSSK